MSEQVYAGTTGYPDFPRGPSIRHLWETLVDRFVNSHDFPLHHSKPEIDNRPRANTPPSWYAGVTWCRGSTRAYLRRRARGRL